MPVVHVRALRPADADVAALLADVGKRVAGAARCEVDDVWCTFGPVDASTVVTTARPAASQVAYVELLMRARDPAVVEAALGAASEAVAVGLSIPVEDVWAHYTPVRSGEVFAGGGMLRWEDEPL